MTDLQVPVQAAPTTSVDANYQYWRDHGGEWPDHYDSRKKRLVLYHIQEVMLTSYILEHAKGLSRPLRVLEFGCGVGRHLANLSHLPNVDVHGYDQSHTMAQGVLRWAGREWFDTHIHVGMPTGRLPFEDGAFDIVYSAEVLVHVRPEHLPGILQEMMRVCRGHVLHIETSLNFPIVTDEHSGCWQHSLPATYAALGKECEVLPAGYAAHTPYRVTVAEPARWTWPPQIIEMYRRMERDLDQGFAEAAARLRATESAAEQSTNEQKAVISDLRLRIGELDDTVARQTMDLVRSTEALAAAKSELASTQHTLAQAQHRIAALDLRLAELEAYIKASDDQRLALIAEVQALQAQYLDLAKAREAALAQINSLTEHLAAVHEGWEGDRTGLQRAIEERRVFVERVSRYLAVGS